jgi:predicted nuclease of restriction endonuclease-like RecB superfamily
VLTRDLVRYKIQGDKISPDFIDPQSPAILEVAGKLIDRFKSAGGKSRSELAEENKMIIEGAPFPAVIARGLEKLLLDRTEFDTAPDEELTRFRRELFIHTSRMLSEEPFSDFREYQERILQEFQDQPAELASRLYSDLPIYQKVTKFKSLSAERLLQRYNTAQVQGLLIHSHTLELKISESRPELLRQLFKYLRFHQLLATIRKDTEDFFWIVVDGPLNLFYKTQKYGLNLALFFPAVLHQQNWELRAEIEFKRQRKYRLFLDKTSGLQPYSHQFLAYVPEEIRLFQETFHQKAPGWEIAPASRFVPLEGEFYCFPDYTLKHSSGIEISLELFHPWHASHLSARLEQLENPEMQPLIIGVSKVLLNDPLVAQSIENSRYFARCGFIFREMPTADKLLPVLGRALKIILVLLTQCFYYII